MKLFRATKGLTSKIVDIRVDKWLSLDYLKETTGHLKSIVTSVVVPERPRYSETFEEALQRLHLTEEDLAARKTEFTRLLYFFVFLSVAIVIYGLSLAYSGALLPALIAFCLSVYSLTQAFRFHFWLFQIKNRKLGVTLKEWFNSSAKADP